MRTRCPGDQSHPSSRYIFDEQQVLDSRIPPPTKIYPPPQKETTCSKNTPLRSGSRCDQTSKMKFQIQ